MTEGNDDKSKDETDTTETKEEKENGKETEIEKEIETDQKQEETEQIENKGIKVDGGKKPEEGNEKRRKQKGKKLWKTQPRTLSTSVK